MALEHMDDVDRTVQIVKLSAITPHAAEIVERRSGAWWEAWFTLRGSAWRLHPPLNNLKW